MQLVACALSLAHVARPADLAKLAHAANPSDLAPRGVNLGGWYVLEDWFYGKNGTSEGSAYHVSSPKSQGALGWSLNINPADRDFMFSSEVDLLAKSSTPVTSLKRHRDVYMGSLADELALIASYGIKYLRLPITWCFNWRDTPITIVGTTNVTLPPHLGEVLVDDPFHGDVCGESSDQTCRWLALPEQRVTDVLVLAHAVGLKVLLDVHAMPGGSSDGTYNGVWPLPPKFWDASNHGADNYRTIVGGLIAWAEELPTRNATAAAALYGITPMNEPGLGMNLDSSAKLGVLSVGVELFRASRLPSAGVKLLVNLINLPDDLVRSWWLQQTSEDERAQWAVLDIHHYVAWPGETWCNDSSLSVDELQQRVAATSDTWQWSVREHFNFNGSSALIAMSEFSGSAHEDTRYSCSLNNAAFRDEAKARAVVRYFVQQQVARSRATDVIDFFWKWHFPYNSNFRLEWSLKDIFASMPVEEVANCRLLTSKSACDAARCSWCQAADVADVCTTVAEAKRFPKDTGIVCDNL